MLDDDDDDDDVDVEEEEDAADGSFASTRLFLTGSSDI
jgi:hypothetical protein